MAVLLCTAWLPGAVCCPCGGDTNAKPPFAPRGSAGRQRPGRLRRRQYHRPEPQLRHGLRPSNRVGFEGDISPLLRRIWWHWGAAAKAWPVGGAWRNAHRREEVFLDVPKIGVKAALDRPADVLVIMLGMNDVLAPYVADEPASLDRWTDDYRALIHALQQRVKPGVTAWPPSPPAPRTLPRRRTACWIA